jgi:hypothetical protein
MILKRGFSYDFIQNRGCNSFILFTPISVYSGCSDLSAAASYEGAEGAADPSLIFFSRTISQTADIFQKTLRKQTTSSLYKEWNRIEWNGIDWNGMEKMEWNGIDWNEMD